MSQLLVLIDRDGTITEEHPDPIVTPETLKLLPGAGEAIACLNRHHIKVAVVTNQSIIGRGLIDDQQLSHIHQGLQTRLADFGAHIDQFFYCPDAPDQATWRRKPYAGMLCEAIVAFDARPELTPMVGDSLIDIEAAYRVRCPSYLVQTGKGQKTWEKGIPKAWQPQAVCQNLKEFVDVWLEKN